MLDIVICAEKHNRGDRRGVVKSLEIKGERAVTCPPRLRTTARAGRCSSKPATTCRWSRRAPFLLHYYRLVGFYLYVLCNGGTRSRHDFDAIVPRLEQ